MQVINLSIGNVVPGVSTRVIAVPQGLYPAMFQIFPGALNVVLNQSNASDGDDLSVQLWTIQLTSGESGNVTVQAALLCDSEPVSFLSRTANGDFQTGE
jgi:hypothetical protein